MLFAVSLLVFLAVINAPATQEHKKYYKLFARESASLVALRKRFRQLAREFHPDKVPAGANRADAERKFGLIKTAYDKLVAKVERGSKLNARDLRTAAERSRVLEELRKARKRLFEEDEYDTDNDESEEGEEFEEDFNFEEAPNRPEPSRAPKPQKAPESDRAHLKREEGRIWEEKQADLRRDMHRSRLLEKVFIMCLSTATVLGILIAYYCISLRDEVEETIRKKKLENSESANVKLDEVESIKEVSVPRVGLITQSKPLIVEREKFISHSDSIPEILISGESNSRNFHLDEPIVQEREEWQVEELSNQDVPVLKTRIIRKKIVAKKATKRRTKSPRKKRARRETINDMEEQAPLSNEEEEEEEKKQKKKQRPNKPTDE